MAKIHWRHFLYLESEEKIEEFLENLNKSHPNLKFTSEKSKKYVNFLDVTVGFIDQHLETDFYCKPIDCHQFLDFNHVHPIHIKKRKKQLSIVKVFALKDYVPPKRLSNFILKV